jgi:hypothetical protein
LRAARLLSMAALFRLKIASSGRGALASTRCAHFSCENKERTSQPSSKAPEKINTRSKKPGLTKISSEEVATYQFLRLLVGEHWEKPRQRTRKSRLPDRLRHAALNLGR